MLPTNTSALNRFSGLIDTEFFQESHIVGLGDIAFHAIDTLSLVHVAEQGGHLSLWLCLCLGWIKSCEKPCPKKEKKKKQEITRKQNLQANSKSTCQIWYKREKEAHRLFAKLHRYSLSTTGAWNGAYFCSMGSGFQDTGQFSKNCHIWEWNLATGKNSRSRSSFWDKSRFSKLPYLVFGHETCPLPKVPGVVDTFCFYPTGQNLGLFLLYRQWFQWYRPIFKIPIFGYETWPLPKVPYVAHILSLYLRVFKIKFIFTLRAAVSEIWVDFQNLRMKFDHWQKFQKLHICSLSTPGVWKFSIFSLYRQHCLFLRYRSNLKIAIFGHETWPLAEVAHILFLYPRGSKLSLFSLDAAVNQDRTIFGLN